MKWVEELKDSGALHEMSTTPRIVSKQIRFDNEKYGIVASNGGRDAVSDHHRSCAMRRGEWECTCP